MPDRAELADEECGIGLGETIEDFLIETRGDPRWDPEAPLWIGGDDDE